jgi:predicted nucleic acid-binding protein
MPVLVDANVIVDTLRPDTAWHAWSLAAVTREAHADLVINPIIYAELAAAFGSPDELDRAVPATLFKREDLPWAAAFQAGKAFLAYRRQKGKRVSPLPDFYIGAHADVAGYRLLTRDTARYRTYFPDVELITPGEPA